MLTQEFLKQRYEYVQGGFFRNKKTGKITRGVISKRHGYNCFAIRFKNKLRMFRYHRLIFLYHHGYLPAELDHVNGVRSDNRIENLRVSDRVLNNANRKCFRALPKGVYKRKSAFQAIITIGGKPIYLGTFKTIKGAADAFSAKHRSAYGDLYS